MTLRLRRFFDEVLSEGTWRRNGKLPSSFRQAEFCASKGTRMGSPAKLICDEHPLVVDDMNPWRQQVQAHQHKISLPDFTPRPSEARPQSSGAQPFSDRGGIEETSPPIGTIVQAFSCAGQAQQPANSPGAQRNMNGLPTSTAVPLTNGILVQSGMPMLLGGIPALPVVAPPPNMRAQLMAPSSQLLRSVPMAAHQQAGLVVAVPDRATAEPRSEADGEQGRRFGEVRGTEPALSGTIEDWRKNQGGDGARGPEAPTDLEDLVAEDLVAEVPTARQDLVVPRMPTARRDLIADLLGQQGRAGPFTGPNEKALPPANQPLPSWHRSDHTLPTSFDELCRKVIREHDMVSMHNGRVKNDVKFEVAVALQYGKENPHIVLDGKRKASKSSSTVNALWFQTTLRCGFTEEQKPPPTGSKMHKLVDYARAIVSAGWTEVPLPDFTAWARQNLLSQCEAMESAIDSYMAWDEASREGLRRLAEKCMRAAEAALPHGQPLSPSKRPRLDSMDRRLDDAILNSLQPLSSAPPLPPPLPPPLVEDLDGLDGTAPGMLMPPPFPAAPAPSAPALAWGSPIPSAASAYWAPMHPHLLPLAATAAGAGAPAVASPLFALDAASAWGTHMQVAMQAHALATAAPVGHLQLAPVVGDHPGHQLLGSGAPEGATLAVPVMRAAPVSHHALLMAPAEGDAPSAPVLTLEQARASTPPAEFESVLEPDSELEPAPGAPGTGMVQMAAGHRTLDSAAEQAAFVSMSAREREAYRSMGTGNEGADVPRGWRCTVGTSPTREQMLARIREADPGLLVFEDGHPTMEILAGAAMAVAAEAAASAAASSSAASSSASATAATFRLPHLPRQGSSHGSSVATFAAGEHGSV